MAPDAAPDPESLPLPSETARPKLRHWLMAGAIVLIVMMVGPVLSWFI